MLSATARRLCLAFSLSSVAIAACFAPTLPGTSRQTAPEYLATANSLPAPPAASRPSNVAEAAPVTTRSYNLVYFKQTGHYVRDAFLNYWLMNGGTALYGYPVSEEKEYGGKTVQYFERARFEYNAASTRPWKVELTLAGSELTAGRDFAKAQPRQGATYFEQTGHNLGGAFKQFWDASGGMAIFGLPISEEMVENGKTVQYFERSRFELAQQGRVQLGKVGIELLEKHKAAGFDPEWAKALARPGFEMTFRGEASWFKANWERVISLNKSWGNLPEDFVGRGLYAAAPADLHLYGRWARVTRGNRSVFVQFIDVINWPDIPYVRNKGIVIDLGEEAYRALGVHTGGRYEVSFDVLWPDQQP
ncbi:MAG: hypothetical protein M3437_20470 [Chloroflexota bacterium]|nr:hypothetical protein [Chloroflexota bacterium]MDQ5865032.1 hypothetical protein [Chloroflexota bacterium]